MMNFENDKNQLNDKMKQLEQQLEEANKKN